MKTATALAKLALALPLATTLLAGCNVHLNVPVLPKKNPGVVQPKSTGGQVQVTFRGLAPYKALATSADIRRVVITLETPAGQAQTHTLDDAQLRQPTVTVDFHDVPPGAVNLDVQAYDASGRQIGEGHGGTRVVAGDTAVAHLTVALAPDQGTGNVTAVIDFVDGNGGGACDDDRFRGADLDGDGFLNRDEFRLLWGRDHAPVPMPVSTADAVIPYNPTIEGDAPGYSIKCAPAMPIDPPAPPEDMMLLDPAMRQFNALDTNHDGLLDASEFCAYAVPGPVIVPPIETPVPVIDPPMPSPLPPMIAPSIAPTPASFDAMDEDHDGHISWEEFAHARLAAPAAPGAKSRLYDQFRQLDANHNGTLERDELRDIDPDAL